MSTSLNVELSLRTVSKYCSQLVRVYPHPGAPPVYIQCGSRRADTCPYCARLYKNDMAHVLRSGVLPGEKASGLTTTQLQAYRVHFITLTAPSFGRCHRVPKRASESRRCPCGVAHSHTDVGWRGVPLDPDTYRYRDQVAWNYGSSSLWNSTRTALRDAIPSMEFACVREWQSRGVLHFHIFVRVPRDLDPGADAIRQLATRCSAVANGRRVRWGRMSDAQTLTGGDDGDGARLVSYTAKALTYASKSLDSHLTRENARVPAYTKHLTRLERTASRFTCPRCRALGGHTCGSACHTEFGHMGRLISVSHGWSFTGVTRTSLRKTRAEWAKTHGGNLDRYDAHTRLMVGRASRAFASGEATYDTTPSPELRPSWHPDHITELEHEVFLPGRFMAPPEHVTHIQELAWELETPGAPGFSSGPYGVGAGCGAQNRGPLPESNPQRDATRHPLGLTPQGLPVASAGVHSQARSPGQAHTT